MAGALRWGILGTGAIACKFALGLLDSTTGRLAALASRSRESVDKFGGEKLRHLGFTRYDLYEHCLADDSVDAIYIATPHPSHAQWAIAAANAGKHVLCEKPLAMNHRQAEQIVEAAQKNNVFVMEAFMYRCHPLVAELIRLLRCGSIGQVRMIHASFGFHCNVDSHHRLINHSLGGGGILDVGCYPVSLARMVAGIADGRDFLDPTDVWGAGVIGRESRVDETASALLAFSNGISASISAAVRCELQNAVHIFGSEGRIEIPWMWVPRQSGNRIIIHKPQAEQVVVSVDATADVYTLEADTAATAIANGQQEPSAPAMSWADSMGNMRTLDRWRQAIGLTYSFADEN